MDTYLLFIVVVYESKDPLGNFLNSTKVEIIDTSRQSAEKRALDLAGGAEKQFAHTTNVFERIKDDVGA